MFKLKAAIIGAGFMGPTHVEGLRRNAIQVIGIRGVDDEETQRVAESLRLEKAYKSMDELLADPDVDVVHVTTPNKLHYDMCKAVLEAGKHVICEKPLAMSSKETADLVKIAEKSGKVAAVNYNLRFYPLAIEARERVQAGEIGDVLSISGSYVQDWLLYDTDYNWRVLASEGGALRAVADIGTHWLDLTQMITGLKVTELCADLNIVHKTRKRPTGEVETFSGKVEKQENLQEIDIDTEDQAAILLRFENGARGTLWVSQTTAGRKNCLRYEIAGSKQALAWDSERPCELWLGSRENPNGVLMKDPSLLSPAAADVNAYPGGHNEGYPDTFKMHFKTVYSYIEAGDFSKPAPFPTFEDGHNELELCEAILKSSKKGSWVKL